MHVSQLACLQIIRYLNISDRKINISWLEIIIYNWEIIISQLETSDYPDFYLRKTFEEQFVHMFLSDLTFITRNFALPFIICNFAILYSLNTSKKTKKQNHEQEEVPLYRRQSKAIHKTKLMGQNSCYFSKLFFPF